MTLIGTLSSGLQESSELAATAGFLPFTAAAAAWQVTMLPLTFLLLSAELKHLCRLALLQQLAGVCAEIGGPERANRRWKHLWCVVCMCECM